MKPIRSSVLCSSSNPFFIFSSSSSRYLKSYDPKSNNPIVTITGKVSSSSTVVSKITAKMNSGFKHLCQTFSVDVQKAEGRPLNVPLIAPFTIASSKLENVENVAIRVELSNGSVGWGESPILPFVTAEDQLTALLKTKEACEFLRKSQPMTLSLVLNEIGELLPGHQFASVRAGVEMALIDAVANSIGLPLWRMFGGVTDTITTDITV